jgi:C4-type Zn-finger protein
VARKVQEVIDALRAMAEGDRFPFTLIIDDPSGNSLIQARPNTVLCVRVSFMQSMANNV